MTVFLTSIQSIIPIIVIIALGYILQTKGWFAESFGPNLSRLIMNVALPVSIFVSVLKYLTVDKLISLSGGLLYTFGAFTLTYVFGFLAVKFFAVRAGRRGTMINTFVNANTIFIGLPLNIALFGDDALPYFLIYYITNTISTWTLGVYIMTTDSVGGEKKRRHKVRLEEAFTGTLGRIPDCTGISCFTDSGTDLCRKYPKLHRKHRNALVSNLHRDNSCEGRSKEYPLR